MLIEGIKYFQSKTGVNDVSQEKNFLTSAQKSTTHNGITNEHIKEAKWFFERH